MKNNMIDLRSDTVTRPSAGMYDAMMSADLGDDVWGDDPTAIAFEAEMAARCGKQAALLLSSGTQSNLAAMLSHCGRGEEIIVGRDYHTYGWEAAGASVLGGIAQYPLDVASDGSISADDVKAAIKPDDSHYPITKLLALENTVSGSVVPQAKIEACTDVARAAGLICHLDGARLANAVVATGKSWAELSAPFDSVSVCLSKGLGTPMGSVLVGDEAFIKRARRQRKLLGGGLRQMGIIAAAAQYAFRHYEEQMAADHRRAAALADGLGKCAGVEAAWHSGTNMAFAQFRPGSEQALQDWLKEKGLLIGAPYGTARFVTHLDVDHSDVERVVSLIDEFYHVH